MESHLTENEKQTRDVAERLALKISERGQRVVVALVGELGAGKTTFVQAFAKAMGIKKRILSPTFLIMKRFPLSRESNFANLFHIDAYRVDAEDLIELGFQEMLKGKNVVLIEWADRVARILPSDTIWLRFSHGSKENERKITINRR